MVGRMVVVAVVAGSVLEAVPEVVPAFASILAPVDHLHRIPRVPTCRITQPMEIAARTLELSHTKKGKKVAKGSVRCEVTWAPIG